MKAKKYLDETNSGLQTFGVDKSYVFIPVQQEKIINNVVALYNKCLKDGYATEEIIILSCYNKGEYGTIAINNKIQNSVNSNSKGIKHGDFEYRIGDPVMQCENNYKATLCQDSYPTEETTFISNGDIGKIIKADNTQLIVKYDELEIYYSKSQLSSLKLAYSISTHKSQGGQFDIVILVTPKAHTFMLNSNLLYVGESRAKKKVFSFWGY